MNRMWRGKLPLPKEDLKRRCLIYIIAELEKGGFEYCEISNFLSQDLRATTPCTDNVSIMVMEQECLAMSMVSAIKPWTDSVIICRQWKRAMPVCRKKQVDTGRKDGRRGVFLGLVGKKSGVSKKRFEENSVFP